MMSNKHNTVLYIGMTNNLIRRVYEHKNKMNDGFTKKYNCHKLVWYWETNNVVDAIRMKWWKREYKENVIKKMNPNWNDLSCQFMA